MSSVLQNFPFVPQNEEQARAVRDRRDAQIVLASDGRSDRFIAVRLVEQYSPEWRDRFGPLRVLNVLRHRIGIGGSKVQTEVQVRDGYVYFDWDSQMGQHIAWIYDDDPGYNRELLASHFYNGIHEIMDEKIRAEIEKVAIVKQAEANAGANEEALKEEETLTEEQVKGLSEEALDQQIEYLKKQKAALKAKTKSDVPVKSEAPVKAEAPEKKKMGRPRTKTVAPEAVAPSATPVAGPSVKSPLLVS